MLNNALKEEIQTAYSSLLEQKGYRARHCQKTMIAEIAKTLGDTDLDASICVIEAGTGTGKTIAYTLAALPVARAFKKKIVIATATVALQEQIVYQDLPDIRTHSGLEFSFALAKGRRRYVCLSRLDQALQGGDDRNLTLSMFEAPREAGKDEGKLFSAMIDALGKGEWDGERDSWPEELEHGAWSRISTDHAQCTQRRCAYYDNCYFYRAREDVHRVDCIVTNQDLVLSDLMMGGGAVLPDPEETIYIFDEGHHLPAKAGNHFSHVLSVYSTRSWLQQMATSLDLACAEIPMLANQVAGLDGLITQATERLDEIAAYLQQFQSEGESVDDGWLYRFPKGEVTDELAGFSVELSQSFDRLESIASNMLPIIESTLEETPAAEREPIEHWLSAVGAMSDRLAAAHELWNNFGKKSVNPPYARWIRFSNQSQIEGMEMQLSSHPVSVADELHERLWSRCAAAVVTSATLSVGRDFSNFQAKSGIDATEVFRSLPSPFHYAEQATLYVPAMTSDPGDADAHTAELTQMIPELADESVGTLVLFTSWRQMLRVYDDTDADFRERVLIQGELSKMEILTRHKSAIDGGVPSCIFGLASFAEGVDLPGNYCNHVIIAKIPFAVPDDPVGATCLSG